MTDAMTDTAAARATSATARPATEADAEALSQTLARAFHDDPLMCFLFRNPATRHRLRQIAMDGSQKLPPRLIATALDLLRSGVEPRIIPLSIAAWMRFLLARTESGDAYIVNDPLAERLTRLARETSGSASALSAALLGVSEVFPAELTDNAAFCADVERRLAQFLQLGVCATVAAVLAESEPGGS